MNIDLFRKCLIDNINSNSNILKLDLRQLKLYFIVMSMMNCKTHTLVFQVKKKDIIDLLQYSNNYKLLYTDIKKLSNLTYAKKYIFQYIEKETGDGFVYFSISDFFRKQYNIITSNFTIFDINNIIRFDKKFSIILYCLLKQYKKIQKRSISITELKHYANLNESYKSTDFINKKLITSLIEINGFSNIYVDYKTTIINHKINDIIFSIQNNDVRISKDRQIRTIYENVFNKTNININLKVIERILDYYEFKVVCSKLLYNIFNSEEEFSRLFFRS